jgi:beta-glucosidase
VADGVTQVTAWPSALTVVQSWDPNQMYAFGQAMGQEQYIKGTNVMLGPGVNLARVPWGGRNFEYLGEDPFLAATMVGPEVAGIQSNNISACVKHYVDNNQEYNRDTVSENVPRRAQVELYYAAFAAAINAGVGSAMCRWEWRGGGGVFGCDHRLRAMCVGWIGWL